MTPDKYQHPTIADIWSEANTRSKMNERWLNAVSWRKADGFKQADMRIPGLNLPEDTQHEVIDQLHRFINSTGLVNAHAGFTSSDVIDNVRLDQLRDSLGVVTGLWSEVLDSLLELHDSAPSEPCLGYTHWQPATRTTMQRRFGFWLRVVSLPFPPAITNKPFGGGSGSGEALNILGMPWPEENTIQSTDHLCEFASAQWMETMAGSIHKICQDIRFLCHTGELYIEQDERYRGSSAMPHKSNPVIAEQICSLARLQPSFTRAIWDAMAFNGMERTLDNSAILRTTLPAMCHNIAYILERFGVMLSSVRLDMERIRKVYEGNLHEATAELQMAAMIRDGVPWNVAYQQIKDRNHGSTN